MPLSITQHYYNDRDDCRKSDDRERVWRTYCRAMLEEMLRREIGAGLTWRNGKNDHLLPIAFHPYWRRIPDHDLFALQDALIRARYKGER